MMITKILPDLSHAVAPSYTHDNIIGQRTRAPPELIIEIENSSIIYSPALVLFITSSSEPAVK